ncbi:MAG: DUF2892 domain-containing protein [Deltaproteobacteria bacterium]
MSKRFGFRRNIGMMDRMFRFCCGIGLILAGTLVFGGTVGTILLIAGVAAIATAIIGFCPLYIPLGISTIGFPCRGTDSMAAIMARCCRGSVAFPHCSRMMDEMWADRKGTLTTDTGETRT